MFSITRLLNNIRNDSIIDYMDIQNKKRKSNAISVSDIAVPQNKKRKLETSFDYLIDSGYKFEEKIIEEIKQKMINNIKNIYELNKINKTNAELFEETKNAILKNKYNVIINGLLIDYAKNIYGLPDLIVKGCWIKKFIGRKFKVIGNCYYIIDIKATTIPLMNGGQFISNAIKWDGYKMQVYSYSKMLNTIQQKETDIGFLMGIRYKYVLNNKEIIKNTFDTLGTIQFNEKLNAEHKLNKSIKWNKYLEQQHNTINVHNTTELKPNMKNKFDKSYSSQKYNLSLNRKEITLLWNCGIQQRENALQHNIESYDDERLTAKILGFKEDTIKYNIIDKMLNILHTDKNIIIPEDNNVLDWRTQKLDKEYYVDFETYNTTTQSNRTIQVLYMIGVGFFEDTIYKQLTFIIDHKNYKFSNINENEIIIKVDNERKLLETFNEFVKSKNMERLIHWSNAEITIYNKKVEQYNIKPIENIWFDLLYVFKNKDYPIIIKECFGFGIKKIINKLYEYGIIRLQWNEDMDDGLLSAIIANKIYLNDYDKNDINNKMISIINYNTIDCKAMYELLHFIRSY